MSTSKDLCGICDRFSLTPWLGAYQWNAESAERYYWHPKAGILCFRHHQSIAEAQLAASRCRLCSIIVGAFKRAPLVTKALADEIPIALHQTPFGNFGASFDSPAEGLVKICRLDLTSTCGKANAASC